MKELLGNTEIKAVLSMSVVSTHKAITGLLIGYFYWHEDTLAVVSMIALYGLYTIPSLVFGLVSTDKIKTLWWQIMLSVINVICNVWLVGRIMEHWQ